MTLALVAAYELLLPRLGRPATIEAVRTAFVEPLGEATRQGTLAMLDAAPDPFLALVAVSKSREEHAFGKGFVFERRTTIGLGGSHCPFHFTRNQD
ncbi:hypothetical protein ACFPOI_53680 [Nonomuraea angiospora]|uniref:Uncharacterized protein n=1 Tax=Nonomuraea angiospora TaxID=46172 RepID=A0ABR9M6D8_9ACTN|nr:hypothetical protein [Nonomuraea angiospora]MBE1588458.1 hypothetical protein [Nonomuraea angiospora]